MNNVINNNTTTFPLQDYEFFRVTWGGSHDDDIYNTPDCWHEDLILVTREAADAWFDDLVKTANEHHKIEWIEMSECRVDGFGAIQGTPDCETLREFNLGDNED